MKSAFLTLLGLAGFLSIGSSGLFNGEPSPPPLPVSMVADTTVRFLAVGDINLGRGVGQKILGGDTLYPFVHVADLFRSYDIVFGNLESQLSDQGGETQHPRENLIFTGPPAGAYSLKMAGVTVVSTANNHALDYGERGHRETIDLLQEAGVAFSGTAMSDSALFAPAIIERKGLKVAVFSCTDIMNMEDERWKKKVAPADTAALFRGIRSVRDRVDFIAVSYHGGPEYSERPTRRTRTFAHATLDAGADLFLGHHPHVPQEIERVGEKVIVYSLGNFVFRQPFAYWTQRSFAFSGMISRRGGRTRLSDMDCLPLLAGDQPEFLDTGEDAEKILARIRELSTPGKETVAWTE